MMRAVQLSAVVLGLGLLASCDYSGDWLFAGAVEGVPGVVHLGDLTPVQINTFSDIAEAVVYGEVGPTGTAEVGGVTFTFQGNGGSVCLWVDPEIATWNTAVAETAPLRRWTWPDNVFDDGDLDISAGLAVYYTGSPGEKIGSFEVRYTDALGETVPIELNECSMIGFRGQDGAHAGRGTPEYCTLSATLPGVSYMVLLENWSPPLDDSRLGYGVLLAEGDCNVLKATAGVHEECLIQGEAIDPSAPDAPGPWTGLSSVPVLPGAAAFEAAYCDAGVKMRDWCEEEDLTNACALPLCEDSAEGVDCRTVKCFCGDPTDMPNGGSF
ncbi:MAG: hypothetical protein JXX28_07520 [Deltaproteobacteria bacterium]|nr:hypothetical protein [Deltaproteobacteria bacterium]